MMARRVMAGRGGFSPKALFAAGEQGVWYDPSDFSTLFQDAAGTTPVTAVEQPVGLMLDKSKGLVLGPELVTNGTFDTNVNGWSPADASASITWVAGGFANVKMLTSTGSGAIQDVTLFSGFAKISIRARKIGSSGNTYLIINAKSSYSPLGQVTLTSQSFATYDFIVPATNGGFRVYLKVEFAGAEMEVDSISVRELPGNHAYQSVSANCPTLSARVNLLTKTEQFDDAFWYKATTNVSVLANAAESPFGTLSADKLIATNVNNVHYTLANYPSGFPAAAYTFSLYAKKAEYGFMRMVLGGAGGINNECFFNLNTGQWDTVGAGYTAAVQNAGNGWWRVSLSGVTTGITLPLISPVPTNGTMSYQGDGTSGIYIWGADLRVANDGVGIPAYQRVNTATDYDTTGFPLYLRFNGVNQNLLLPCPIPGTGNFTIFSGSRLMTTTAGCVVVGGGEDSRTEFYAHHYTNTPQAGKKYISAWGSAASKVLSQQDFTIETVVSTSSYNGLQHTYRVNTIAGNSVSKTDSNLSATKWAVGAANIGESNIVSLFNGRLYQLIVRGAQSSANLINAAERYVARKAGVTL